MVEKPAAPVPVRPAATAIAAQPGISVDRLLHQYGKTHLQLIFSEEQLTAARQQVASMEAQLKAALKKLAEQDDYIKKLERICEAALGDQAADTLLEARNETKGRGVEGTEGLTKVSEIKLPRPEAQEPAATDS